MDKLDVLIDYLPLLIPFIILELGLMITALLHVMKHPHYRFGNRGMWILIVAFIQIIGPIIYFVFGRGDRE